MARDLALCRRCGENFSYADRIQESESNAMDLTRPPKGAWFRQHGRNQEAGASTRSAGAFFLIPFTLAWSGLSLGGIYGTQLHEGEFQPSLSLFGLPFLVGTCFLVPTALMMVCGRVIVRRRGGEGEIFTGIFGLGWRRRFRWSDVKTIKFGRASWRQNYQPVRQIFLEADRTLKFGSGLSEERQNFLLAAVRQMREAV